jgi:molecular chaperone IbpA
MRQALFGGARKSNRQLKENEDCTRSASKIFRLPLETKTGFANFFVATCGWLPRCPPGPRDRDGHRSCPVPHTHLALWRIWLCALTTSLPCSDRPSVSIACSTLAETAQRATDEGYPPYNIERLAEDRYQITLAVAGFSPDEISITAEQNVATIEGGKTEKAEREFLYRGISTRHFKRQFNLADYVQVKGAAFDNGLLKIELVREIPEAMKPRRIAINGASTSDNVHQIEAKAA